MAQTFSFRISTNVPRPYIKMSEVWSCRSKESTEMLNWYWTEVHGLASNSNSVVWREGKMAAVSCSRDHVTHTTYMTEEHTVSVYVYVVVIVACATHSDALVLTAQHKCHCWDWPATTIYALCDHSSTSSDKSCKTFQQKIFSKIYNNVYLLIYEYTSLDL